MAGALRRFLVEKPRGTFVEDSAVDCQYRAGFSVARPINVPKATVCGKEGSRESSDDSPALLKPPKCNL